MKHLEKLTRKRLGEILIAEGLITKTQLADAEREQSRTGETLGSILVEASYIHEADLAKLVATQYQLPFVRLSLFPKSKEMSALFPVEQMRKLRFVPIDRIGDILTLAVAEMPDIGFLHDLKDQHEVTPFLFVTLMDDILERLDGDPGTRKLAAQVEEAPPAPKPAPKPAARSPDVPEEILEGLQAMEHILPEDSGVQDAGSASDGKEFPGPDDSDGSWENIFDVANESILNEIDKE